MCDLLAIGFRFASDWLKEWRDFSRPITVRSKGNKGNLGLLTILNQKLVELVCFWIGFNTLKLQNCSTTG